MNILKTALVILGIFLMSVNTNAYNRDDVITAIKRRMSGTEEEKNRAEEKLKEILPPTSTGLVFEVLWKVVASEKNNSYSEYEIAADAFGQRIYDITGVDISVFNEASSVP